MRKEGTDGSGKDQTDVPRREGTVDEQSAITRRGLKQTIKLIK